MSLSLAATAKLFDALRYVYGGMTERSGIGDAIGRSSD
jgi:hypothetical protein